jgi:hypothetical protein
MSRGLTLEAEQQHSLPQKELYAASPEELAARLAALGVAESTVQRLLADDRARRRAAEQLRYLGLREGIRDSAAAIVAAIREDWPPPSAAVKSPPETSRGDGAPALDRLRAAAEEHAARVAQLQAALEAMDPVARRALEERARRAIESEAPGLPVPAAALKAYMFTILQEEVRQDAERMVVRRQARRRR